MKIAILHNYMDNIGGAEIVDFILARELKADIYTTNIDPKKIKKMGFNTHNILSIGKIPINAPFKQEFAYQKFKKLKLKDYDLYIIAGDWAMSASINNKPNIWYIYSPIREIWDLYEYTRENNVPFYAKPIFDLWVKHHRRINKKNIKHINKFISISDTVKERIKKYLNKNSIVINPPVETSKYYYQKTGNFWLSVNRLINHKRVDLQMKAFSKMPKERLILVGSYEQSKHFKSYTDYIRKIKPKNVEILSWVDQKQLRDLYANCKGFITTSHNEDFGLTPIEAMASGKPVIAPKEGGYKETVTDKTGILIEDIDSDKLTKIIKQFKNPEAYKKECIKQAKKFDTKIFIKKIKKEIKNVL